MNQYQTALKRKFYVASIAIEPEWNNRMHYHNISHQDIHKLARQYPDADIVAGSINGKLFIHQPGINLPMTCKYLDEHMDTWLKNNMFVPDLYIVGGYYPRKDGLHVFDIQRTTGHIYVYIRKQATELPVYLVSDDKLIRIACGCIPSPEEVKITPKIHAQLISAIKSDEIYKF